MTAEETIAALGYDDSPNLLRPADFTLDGAGAFAHVLRQAAGERISLRAAYSLRGPGDPIPLVYVCEVEDERRVREIHRLVWNQDAAPCLILASPEGVRVYSGFDYETRESRDETGILGSFVGPDEIAERMPEFSAKALDSGSTWTRLSGKIHTGRRLNLRLLNNLLRLNRRLQSQGLEVGVSHALIGKYVYLHYLRDRGILSPDRLDLLGLSGADVFGPKTTLADLEAVSTALDNWLNGGVFPLDFSRKGGLRSAHVKQVAGIFAGADISAGGDQLHLDFPAYDFAHIPVETLSVVYEQFLHDGGAGAETGTYYTPIPVVNLMLSQLDHERPLRRGMKVFDSACGSGAFLVQAFRRLIEREYPPGTKPRPGELRELLEKSIFGIDIDADACAVAQLSLTLTLLDYIDPPDLRPPLHNFKLPNLLGSNLVVGDAFTCEPPSRAPEHRYDWVVGNPPWKKIGLKNPPEEFEGVASWIKEHAKTHPVGNNEVGRAFAWKADDFLAADGRAALLLPAMSLFETKAADFRARFFSRFQVGPVANFSNLAEVLAKKRFRVPSAAFFFRPRGEEVEDSIRVFSPLVANQEITCPRAGGRERNETWAITVDASDVREMPLGTVVTGDSLPWKTAVWGTPADEALLRRLERRFPTLEALEADGVFEISEGLQLRGFSDRESLEEVDWIVGKPRLDVTRLAKWRDIFAFPDHALEAVPADHRWVRKRGGVTKPISVCRPPHVIISAARNFAVYSEKFLVVPARQIGVVSPSDDRRLLKALAVFMNSDFIRYHSFLMSSQVGVKREVSTLAALRDLPMPISQLSSQELDRWCDLHSRLTRLKPQRLGSTADEDEELDFDGSGGSADSAPLLRELNQLVGESLGLSQREQDLIQSLMHVRIHLRDGKTGEPAMRAPDAVDLKAYTRALKADLDGFLGLAASSGHDAEVFDLDEAMLLRVGLDGDRKGRRRTGRVRGPVPDEVRAAFDMLRREYPQWSYFRRALRYHRGRETWLLKPRHRFHWTVAQATIDAAAMIADHLPAAR